ncbi:MAG: hypothetical protein HKN23_07695 [Verrucomicrobiales bacterium]|nr:hypothetical protein [Verrucomicrobiales bacterium]
MNNIRRFLFLAAAIVVSGFANVSCTTTDGDGAGRPGGIQGSGGATRENLYEMQDRTFRQLAY